MSTTHDLVTALKAELKAAGITYADLAVQLDMAESQAANFVERLQRVGQDFAQQHLADQKLGAEHKRPYALVVGLRSWLFAPLRDLKRPNPPRT